MQKKRGGYSFLIRPILFVMDIGILIFYSFHFIAPLCTIQFLVFLCLSWLISAYMLGFYEVYRYTRILKIISLLIQQGSLLLVLMYAYFGLLRITAISFKLNSRFMLTTIVTIGIIKIILYIIIVQAK